MKKIVEQYSQTISEISILKQMDEILLITSIKEGSWSIREIIAHLYGWDDYNLKHMIGSMAPGANLPAFPDHDAQNERAVESLKNKTVYEIIDLFTDRRKECVDAILKVEPKTRFTIGGGKRAFSAESFIKIFVKHDAHHLGQIDAFMKKTLT
ncbi:DinB family protein [Alkalicoccobacillus porphyridii]|uniref:DinB family protein n=2 Tax=Alkalicoccobacillus porphyridii TaxID=2597270 RepID=A0A554A2Q1_9BACI|nr:DinB family protein [Alkalicoccobacillus porphyridii]